MKKLSLIAAGALLSAGLVAYAMQTDSSKTAANNCTAKEECSTTAACDPSDCPEDCCITYCCDSK